MIKKIGISLILTSLISLGIGFILQSFIGFWQGVTAAFIIHFLIFYLFNPNKKSQIFLESEQSAFNHLLQTQTVEINCPCGQNPTNAPILLNEDNIFICEKCASKYRVNATFESVLLTEPLNIENAFNALKKRELPYTSV
jgi:hypothetical protein